MAVLDIGKAYTFSGMNLKITHDGNPAANAKVTRIVEWQKEQVDEFTADEHGYVALPEVKERSLSQLLPVQFVVAQVVNVEFEGKEYEIWVNSKMSPDKNSELGGHPLDLKCELTREPVAIEDFDTILVTNCQWN
ncbi:DUF6795 domain-containing protein [Microbulbifer harenosus]|uniref:DUF6795 domain-containing protein n=1 Tax=Microbulbifer harenosus TaxID=2576840 RepID=A0ABY2UKU4_9GAMM|nr:DUF6795 domain-containing protein [Microbulbifer harenosus]TLM78969.1 hypothetical protein FDY93_02335 [Microbulbifer harenosus]